MLLTHCCSVRVHLLSPVRGSLRAGPVPSKTKPKHVESLSLEQGPAQRSDQCGLNRVWNEPVVRGSQKKTMTPPYGSCDSLSCAPDVRHSGKRHGGPGFPRSAALPSLQAAEALLPTGADSTSFRGGCSPPKGGHRPGLTPGHRRGVMMGLGPESQETTEEALSTGLAGPVKDCGGHEACSVSGEKDRLPTPPPPRPPHTSDILLASRSAMLKAHV